MPESRLSQMTQGSDTVLSPLVIYPPNLTYPTVEQHHSSPQSAFTDSILASQRQDGRTRTPCECSYTVFQTIAENREQAMVSFENVLETSRRVFIQWETAMACEHCRTSRQTMMIVPMAAERILALYEAACLSYGITPLDSGMSNHRDSPQSSSPVYLHTRRASGIESCPKQVVCLKSTMRFGKMELEGNDAKMLVRSLLSRRLLKLCALLGDLKELTEKLWHKDWTQQTDTLKTCERLTTFILDQVVALIGDINQKP